MSMYLHRRRGAAGFSLIEVMVAVAILSIGLLGIAALQIQGLRQNSGSYSRSQAVMLTNDFAERLYANHPGAASYAGFDSDAVNCSTPPTPRCAAQNGVAAQACTPEQMAADDRYLLACGAATSTGRYGGAKDLLPQGRLRSDCLDASSTPLAASTACPAGSRLRIAVDWQERGAGAQDWEAASFTLTVQP